MPLHAHKFKPLWTKPVVRIIWTKPAAEAPRVRQPRQEFIAPDTKDHAKALTLARGGDWNAETNKGRNAGCFACGGYQMAVTPKNKGVLLACNDCHAERTGELFEAAVAAGFECGPGSDRRRRGNAKLPAASDTSVAELKPAEKRVLAFCAKETSTRDWFEVSRRSIVGTCNVSARDAIPLLGRLAKRGLLRVRSNNYAAKRRTQIGFLVDPVDLVRRFDVAQRFKAAA